MLRRSVLLASATLLVAAASALAQTSANLSAAQLLSPFTTLNATAAGRGALDDNLAATIAINNGASAARKAQAVSDNSSTGNGGQFTGALGTTLDKAYQTAIAQKDAAVTTLTSQIGAFTTISGSDIELRQILSRQRHHQRRHARDRPGIASRRPV